MKRNSWLTLIVVLLLGILVGTTIIGCAEEAAPAPTPAPAPSPAPTPAPTEPVEIDLLATTTQTTGYQAAFAFSEVVNKYSAATKLTAVESKSHEINLQRYIDEPAARVNRFYLSNAVDWSKARDGRGSFTAAAPGLKAVFTTVPKGAACFVGYDPSIAEPEGLEGKTVAVNVSAVIEYLPNVLLNHWGIFDQGKYMKVGLPKVIGALMDGTADVGFVPIANPRGPNNWSLNPLLIESVAKDQLYLTNVPAEDIETLAAKNGDAFYPQLIPQGALGENFPIQDTIVPGFAVCFWADENMDEELIYNIVKAAIEHDDEFEGYLGPAYKGYANFMAAAPLPGGEADWHPGALKAYKEAGLKIGEWTLE